MLYLSLVNDTRCTRNKVYSEPVQSAKSNIAKKSFRYRAQKVILSIPEFNPDVNFNAFKTFVKTLFIDKQRTERMHEIFELINDFEFDNCMY